MWLNITLLIVGGLIISGLFYALWKECSKVDVAFQELQKIADKLNNKK